MYALLVIYLLAAQDYGLLTSRVGDICSSDQNCAELANSRCFRGKCVCNAGYYSANGEYYCAKVTIGVPCPSQETGTAFCEAGVTRSVCHYRNFNCVCPTNYGLVFTGLSKPVCMAALIEDSCDICTKSGGVCYDSDGDGVADECGCPEFSMSSNTSNSLTTGCDLRYAYVNGKCAKDGSIICDDINAECVNDALSSDYFCSCQSKFIPSPLEYDPSHAKCVRQINKFIDSNCTTCEDNGGKCSDLDDNNIQDGCVCPLLRSSSTNAPIHACDTNHAKVCCNATEMMLCLDTPFTITEPESTAQIDIVSAYARGFKDVPSCIFKAAAATTNSLCIRLNYTSDTCGPTAVDTTKMISFHHWSILKLKNAGGKIFDFSLYSFCVYNKQARTSDVIQELTVKRIVATEGFTISPTLSMSIKDKFGNNVDFQGVSRYEAIKLAISITDDKDVYTSLRADVCVVSNLMSVDLPAVQTSVFIMDACFEANSLMKKSTNFYPLANDSKTIQTGYFPAPKFVNNDFIYFHCAVKVCLHEADCVPKNCSVKRILRSRSMNRINQGSLKVLDISVAKRSVAGHTVTVNDAMHSPDLAQTVVGCSVKDIRSNDRQNPLSLKVQDKKQQKIIDMQKKILELELLLSKDDQSSGDHSRDPGRATWIIVSVVGSSLFTLVIGVVISFLCFVLPIRRSYRRNLDISC